MCVLLSLHQAYGQHDALVAHWNFDEGKGSVIHDASGNGHTGTVKNPKWVSGKIHHALSFESGCLAEIPDHPELRLQKDFTIAAWIRKTGASRRGKSMGIVSKSSQGAWDYDLFMSTTMMEHPGFYSDAFQAAGGDIEVISSRPLSLNRWHHVAVTREGPVGKIYIDGHLSGTAQLPETLNVSSRNVSIGYDHDGSFHGSIDEVRIYARALSEGEIRQVMHEESAGPLTFRHSVVDASVGGIRVVADVDGDKNPDIIHCYWYESAPLCWYEYRNPGVWQRHIIQENFYPVTDNFELADMDEDGDVDIIMASSAAKRSDDPNADNIHIDKVNVIWFENPAPNNNPRTFSWKQHDIGDHVDSNENYIKDIKAADFTGDGFPEIVLRSNVAVSVFLRGNRKSWEQIQYMEIHPHEGMDVGDVDCDGDPDIVLNGFWLECPEDPVAGTWQEHSIHNRWWTQTGDWTANNCKVVAEDINKDGCADVVLSHSERPGYPVAWYEKSNGAQDIWTEHIIDTVDFCHTLQVADMDLDGDVDILTGEMEKSADPDQIMVFLSDGHGLRWKKQLIVNAAIYSGKVADLENDGDPDIIGNRSFNKPPLEILENLLYDKTTGERRK